MSGSSRVFVAAWEYPPILSGESVVCRRTLEHSALDYDVCCGPVEARGDGHIRLFPRGGNKYLLWPFAAARCFRELDRTEDYRVMMSRVMPPNGHLAGWLIKRIKPSLRWVVYFSDPIWNSPFLRLLPGRRGDHRPKWLLMKLFGIPAKWAVREGDLLVFNNERLARYVLGKRYARYRDKVLIAPYGHEGVKPRPPAERGDGKLRLTHVGQLYGNRTLEALLGGLTLLKERSPELYRRLAVRQVGFASERERKRAAASPAGELVEFAGQVPYGESIEEMYRADWLLVIDPVFDDPRKNIYIPGKLYDYLSTGRPILCIAAEDSATGDAAKQAGLLRCAPTAEQVYTALRTVLEGTIPPDTSGYGAFVCQVGVGYLDTNLKELDVWTESHR